MSRSIGGVVLAPRASVTLSVADLDAGLPPVCAVSGARAEETMSVPASGGHAPPWLLLFGLTPYFIVRGLLGSGSSVKVALPVTKRVADFLALGRTAQVIGVVLAAVSLIPGFLAWPFQLILLLPALLVVIWGAVVVHALSIRPSLVGSMVRMQVSQQLRDALLISSQPL